jgi:hypothetical protein
VALYRGLPYELPLGVELYQERYASPVQTDSLAPRRREAVTGHDLRSRSDAVSLIVDIERSEGVGIAARPATEATGATGASGGGGTTGPTGAATPDGQGPEGGGSAGGAGGSR